MFERVPGELRHRKRWMLWNYNSEGSKIPLRVGGLAGSSTDESAWSSFNIVVDSSAYYQGIATVIADPYTGVDLDNCIDESGQLREWVLPIIARFDGLAYAEISPSGRGIKLITRARKPDGSRCQHKIDRDKQQIECYDRARFWTITGNVYAGNAEIGDGQEAVDWLCRTYLQTGQKPQATRVVPLSSNLSLMDRARRYVESAEPAGEGGRNNAAFRLAGHLRAMRDDLGGGLSDDDVLYLMSMWNDRCSPPLSDSELQHVTDSAGRNGTARPAKLPEMPVMDIDPGVDLSGIMRMTAAEAAKLPDVPVPQSLWDVPGLIGDIVRHNLATAHYPLPELALAGAITLMASITGGKVTDKLRTRTNLYTLGLAPSGAGKDHARKLNRQILQRAGAPEIIGPERIGSHSGIVSALAENWNTLFQIDEIGKLIMTMQDHKSPHLFNVASVLLQIFSSADSVWQADAYGDRRKVKMLFYPHCCIYGTSVPDGFWEALSKDNLRDGLIGRFLIFEASNYVDYQEPQDCELPQSIVERAAWWLSMTTHSGNLAGRTQHEGANPRRVERDKEAHERLHQHAMQISERRKSEDSTTAAIWSRAAEKTNKLALLFACSRAAGEDWPVIRLEDADRAIALNNLLTRRMLRQAGLHVSESLHERDQLRVLRKMLERPQWTQSELTRATRWLRPRDRIEILTTLAEAGQIEVQEVETSGRKCRIFFPKA